MLVTERDFVGLEAEFARAVAEENLRPDPLLRAELKKNWEEKIAVLEKAPRRRSARKKAALAVAAVLCLAVSVLSFWRFWQSEKEVAVILSINVDAEILPFEPNRSIRSGDDVLAVLELDPWGRKN